MNTEKKIQIPLKDESKALIAAIGDDNFLDFVIFLTAFLIVLRKYTAQSTIRLHIPEIAPTPTPSFKSIDFAISPEETIKHVLKEVRSTLLDGGDGNQVIQGDDALGWNAFPGEILVKSLDLLTDCDEQHWKGLMVEYNKTGITFFNGGALSCEFLENLGEQINWVLIQFKNLEREIDDINFITQGDNFYSTKSQPLSEDESVVTLFEKVVRKYPDAIALDYNDVSFTYLQLNDAANILAHELMADLEIQKGDVVALMVSDSPFYVIGLLATFKMGAIHVPILPANPRERNRHILEDTNAKLLLLESMYFDAVRDFSWISMYAMDLQLAREGPTSNLSGEVRLSDFAYIIFTSGSTGPSKGILLKHYGLADVVDFHVRQLRVGPADRCLKFMVSVFDGALLDVFTPLLAGGTLILVDEETRKDPLEFGRYTTLKNVTLATLVPSYLKALDKAPLPTVRTLISAGEVLPVELAQHYAGTIEVYNGYGPTEASINTTLFRVPEKINSRTVPIGKPTGSKRIILLDDKLRPVPKFGVGEICVQDKSLAEGYLNNPELTAEKFITTDYSESPIYRTGDLVRLIDDDNFEYVGRKDLQVKIRGNRIDLNEIEFYLQSHPQVKECAVLYTGERIQAVIVPVVSQENPQKSWVEFLKTVLPAYMIPSEFVSIDRLPLTATGKIDRKYLETLCHSEIPRQPDTEGAPRNDHERIIAGIWSDVLAKTAVGVNDDFFDVGGDSIKAIQISARLHDEGIKLQVKDILRNATIAKQALLATQVSELCLPEETGEVPLTPVQKAFISSSYPGKSHFNQAAKVTIRGNVEKDTIQSIVKEIINSHDGLRISYDFSGPEVIQRYNPKIHQAEIYAADYTADPEATRKIAADIDRIQKSLNLENGPLLKVGYFKSGDETQLAVIVHHLVSDGISLQIVLSQLLEGIKGKMPNPSKIRSRVSYKQWSVALQEYYGSEKGQAELGYWALNAQKPFQRIPRKSPVPHITSESEVVSFSLTAQETKALTEFARKHCHRKIDAPLMAALATSFADTFAIEDIGFLLEGHGRQADLEKELHIHDTIGWFTSFYPVVAQTGRSPEAVARSIASVLHSVPNHGLGFGYFKDQSPFGFSLFNEFPEFQIIYNNLGTIPSPDSDSSIVITDEDCHHTHCGSACRLGDFEFTVSTKDSVLSVHLVYSPRQYEARKINKIMAEARQNLQSLCRTNDLSAVDEVDLDGFTYKLSVDDFDAIF